MVLDGPYLFATWRFKNSTSLRSISFTLLNCVNTPPGRYSFLSSPMFTTTPGAWVFLLTHEQSPCPGCTLPGNGCVASRRMCNSNYPGLAQGPAHSPGSPGASWLTKTAHLPTQVLEFLCKLLSSQAPLPSLWHLFLLWMWDFTSFTVKLVWVLGPSVEPTDTDSIMTFGRRRNITWVFQRVTVILFFYFSNF